MSGWKQRSSAAFSLLEVLMAISILASVLVFLLGTFLALLGVAEASEERTRAAEAGERAIALIQSLSAEVMEEWMKPADGWWEEIRASDYDPRRDAQAVYFDRRGQFLGHGADLNSNDRIREVSFQAIYIQSGELSPAPAAESDLLRVISVRIGWPVFVRKLERWFPVAPSQQQSLFITTSWRR